MVKMDKYTILITSIGVVFLLAIVDAYQDMWSTRNVAKGIINIFLVAFFATLPAFIFLLASKQAKSKSIKFNSFLLASILSVVSLMLWSYGVIKGSAPHAPGAQQMHLLFWPILIHILSLILFILSVILLKGYIWLRLKIT